ncbi:hypothetical protein F5B19DRAFT_498746 [Rostrohypoxylon terebratum]|nr:hypothetical protein F5B19DRAFT_498746 [Rostrohypoxylon terebratum]
MILKSTITQAVLVAACLTTTGLCEEAVGKPVAWLRGVQNRDSVHVPKLDALNQTLLEIQETTPIKENYKMTEKRDPKRRPSNTGSNANKKNSTNQDDSGVGKADISMHLSIGVGLIIVAMSL